MYCMQSHFDTKYRWQLWVQTHRVKAQVEVGVAIGPHILVDGVQQRDLRFAIKQLQCGVGHIERH